MEVVVSFVGATAVNSYFYGQPFSFGGAMQLNGPLGATVGSLIGGAIGVAWFAENRSDSGPLYAFLPLLVLPTVGAVAVVMYGGGTLVEALAMGIGSSVAVSIYSSVVATA